MHGFVQMDLVRKLVSTVDYLVLIYLSAVLMGIRGVETIRARAVIRSHAVSARERKLTQKMDVSFGYLRARHHVLRAYVVVIRVLWAATPCEGLIVGVLGYEFH